jgi:thiamine kinase-like enzyme
VPGDARARRFCHNDLHHLNLVESAAGVLALDWEYAGVGDPLMDLAGYAAYHDLDAAAVRALLDAHAGAGVANRRFEDARWLFEAVWWAWLELKRRLDGSENGDSREARARLAARLALTED